MRLDVDNPAGAEQERLMKRVFVYLDGVLTSCCTVVDDEEGYIVWLVVEDGELRTETLFGDVRIVAPES